MTSVELKKLLATIKSQPADIPQNSDYCLCVNAMTDFIEKKLDSDVSFTKEDLITVFDYLNAVREQMRAFATGRIKSADEALSAVEYIFAGIAAEDSTLTECIENDRMKNLQLEKAPEMIDALSSCRYRITLHSADKHIDGFFTEDNKLFDFDRDKKIENMLIAAMNDVTNQNNRLLKTVCRNILKSKYGAGSLMLCMEYKPDKRYNPENDKNLFGAYKKSALNKLNVLGMEINQSTITDILRNRALVDLLLRIRAPFKNEEVMEFVREAEQYSAMNINASRGSNLAGRNVAMTNAANILGVSYVVARSVPAGISWEDKCIHGAFTDVVDGLIPPEEIEDYVNTDFMYIKDNTCMDGACLKSMAELQVLDYICGNVDRHQCNFAYQIGEDGQMKGIQGFDNDFSFGVEIPEDNKARDNGVALDNITVISEAMYKRIMKLDERTLRSALGGNGLKEEEIDACVERMNRVKEHLLTGKNETSIKLGKIKPIKDTEWAELKLDYLADLVGNVDGVPMDNIFSFARIIRNEVLDNKTL